MGWKACQFSGVEHIRLVSLLVTFAAIWASSYGCPAQPSRTGPLPACVDASFGLQVCDSRHLLVICRFSGVRIFRGLILWHPKVRCPDGKSLTCRLIGLWPGLTASAVSSCCKCNDIVLCTLESIPLSACPLGSHLQSLYDLFEEHPSWQPPDSTFTTSNNSRLQSLYHLAICLTCPLFKW